MRAVQVAALLLPFASAAPHDPRQNLGAGVEDGLGGLAGVLGGDQEFDYVIVGAGTAGLPLAYRLSEDPNTSVAVVEAGSFYQVTNPIFSATPGGDVAFCGASPLSNSPFVDWNIVTTPQTGASGRSVHYARGRCLGGTSARNFMIYQRPTKSSLQIWADNVGDQSYAWDNFLPYFKKTMHLTPPDTVTRAQNATVGYNPASFSPSGGPGQVSYAKFAQPWSSYVEGALNEIGIPKVDGFNDGDLIGTAYCSSTIDGRPEAKSARASSQETFLNAARAEGRKNLKVFSLTMAKKIIFDSSKRATGVQVASAGVLPYTLKAKKEVIVSAGAFHSPQLLMVSGIGSKDQLTKYGIQVIKENNAVGQGMQDHVFFGPSSPVSVDTFTKIIVDPVYLASVFAEYEATGTGPLSNPVADFLGWEKVPNSMRSKLSARAQRDLTRFPADWPELEYITAPGFTGDFKDLIVNQLQDGREYGTILATLVAPLSRGNVTLASADTNILPIVNPNWLVDPTDQEVAVAAFKRARQAFASKFMKPIIAGEETSPGPKVQSDADILKYIQSTLMTVWHASATCKMGKDDTDAVVDSKARVFGVQGLRVVDASAFNLLPPGHPQSTVYALAEKIADDIKAANR